MMMRNREIARQEMFFWSGRLNSLTHHRTARVQMFPANTATVICAMFTSIMAKRS